MAKNVRGLIKGLLNLKEEMMKAKDGKKDNKLDVNQIVFLLLIYHAGRAGIDYTELSNAMGVSHTVAGSNVKKYAAAGYVRMEIDPLRPRYRLAVMTDKGLNLINEFLESFQ